MVELPTVGVVLVAYSLLTALQLSDFEPVDVDLQEEQDLRLLLLSRLVPTVGSMLMVQAHAAQLQEHLCGLLQSRSHPAVDAKVVLLLIRQALLRILVISLSSEGYIWWHSCKEVVRVVLQLAVDGLELVLELAVVAPIFHLLYDFVGEAVLWLILPLHLLSFNF